MAPFRAFKPVSLGLLLTFVSVCSLPTCVSAERKNFTVDDAAVEDGEPRITYSPLDVWKQGSDCGPCTAHPDASEALDGTWHDITFGAHGFTGSETASMDFNGVAVYVYCIVSNSKHYPTSLTFFIDGEDAGSYSTSPTSTDDTSFNYNVLVYSNDALESGDHSIEIQNGGQGVQDSVVLLDYIVYS
ncbi:hypothetical protein BC629DRAFT_1289840 [Irpex lacteus]|nr:hypothetical protein BC629DRAFT_1289840 [Irpex lacteus]